MSRAANISPVVAEGHNPRVACFVLGDLATVGVGVVDDGWDHIQDGRPDVGGEESALDASALVGHIGCCVCEVVGIVSSE